MRLLPLTPLVSLLLCLGSRALAQEQVSEHPIARREALLLGAKHGPGVALALAPREAVVTLGRRASGLVRPPVLTVGGGYRAGALTPGAELNVSLAQEVPLAGVGGARSEFAKSFAHSVDTDAKRARLEAASRAALAWIDALLARELLRLREEGQTEANAILKITASRVEAGVAPPHELSLARGEAAAAQAGVLDAEGLQVEALAELRFAIGVEPTAAVTAAGDLYGADERTVDDESAVRAALAQNPSILLAVARAEQARGETRLSAAMWGPSLNVGATYVREGSGDRVFLGFVGIPIPLFDAAGFETSRQRAAQLTAESQVELTRAEIARDIRLALHDRQHWREVRDALQHGALAAYGEAFRSAQTQYEVGTSEIGPVILARQRLLGARERLAEVAARVQRADLAVARATGALIEEAKP